MLEFTDLVYTSPYLIKRVKELLDLGVDPSGDDNFAIRYASKYGHKEVVELLLKDPRVDPSSNNNCAIRFASDKGHKEVVELLLKDPRVNPSDGSNCAIRWASDSGHTEVVELLLKDPRVQVKSYRLGQEFHTEKQISELKKTKPYLFI